MEKNLEYAIILMTINKNVKFDVRVCCSDKLRM
jgi:hypothetical protein